MQYVCADLIDVNLMCNTSHTNMAQGVSATLGPVVIGRFWRPPKNLRTKCLPPNNLSIKYLVP